MATEIKSGVLSQRERESTVLNRMPKRGDVATLGNTLGMGSRPRNWLVPVILLSIREWNSYGYELMERARTKKANQGPHRVCERA